MIIKNLQPIYNECMWYLPITTFEQLFDVGTMIEDAIKEGKIKKDEDLPRGKHMGGIRLTNHAIPNIITFYKDTYQNLMSSQSNDWRTLTQLGMTLSTTLDQLIQRGYIKPLDRTSLPNPVVMRYNPH